MISKSTVSMLASGGRSSSGTAGSTAVATPASRMEEKTDECASGRAEMSAKVTSVAARPWCATSRRAISAIGMRWPAPGLATSTTRGRGGAVRPAGPVLTSGSIGRVHVR
jgi:hypothetical protein